MAFERRRWARTNPRSLMGRINQMLVRQPFLTFGLPFIGIMVASSFLLENFTQIRYERQQLREQTLSKEQELGIQRNRRKVDLREEYNRLQNAGLEKLDHWENKRVERLPGEEEPLWKGMANPPAS